MKFENKIFKPVLRCCAPKAGSLCSLLPKRRKDAAIPSRRQKARIGADAPHQEVKNKKTISVTLLSAMLILSACGGNNNETVTALSSVPAAETTSAVIAGYVTTDGTVTEQEETKAVITDIVLETEEERHTAGVIVTEETTAAQQTAQAEETAQGEAGKTVLYTSPDGKDFYLEDAAETDEMYEFDAAYARTSTGTYHDSRKDPDLFSIDEYSYGGERAKAGGYSEIKAGDIINGHTVSEAGFWLYKMADAAYPFRNYVRFDDEITLTGVIRFYVDEAYTISTGSIIFIPDSSYEGMPDPEIAYRFPLSETTFGSLSFNTDDEGGLFDDLAVYSDAPIMRLGNLFDEYFGYSDDPDITDAFNGGGENLAAHAQVTLTDVNIEWSDQFGNSHSTAKIKNIKILE